MWDFRMVGCVVKSVRLSTLVLLGVYGLATSTFAYQNTDSNLSIQKVEGIPQSDIRNVFKDSKGFVWLATLDGLFRFDGYTCKNYRISQDPNSISSNMIGKIGEDHLGNIWVTTFGKGLCKLNPVTEEFTSYRIENSSPFKLRTNDISAFLLDGTTLWVGNWKELIRVKLDSTMSEIVSQDHISLHKFNPLVSNLNVQTIFKDREGKIWLGLNVNLIRINNPTSDLNHLSYTKKSGNVSVFQYCDSILVAAGEFVSEVQTDKPYEITLLPISYTSAYAMQYDNGIMWLGNRTGVYAFKKQEDSYQQISHFTPSTADGLSSFPVSHLCTDGTSVWVGTIGGGVYLVSPNDQYFKYYKKTNESRSLKDDHIKAIFEDSKQDLWVGTEQGGLNFLKGEDKYNYAEGFGQISMENYPREYNRVYAIAEQFTPRSKIRERLIWLGTSFPTFLVALDPSTMELLPQSDHMKGFRFVFAIEVQNDSTLWAGTYGAGIWRLKTDEDGAIIQSQQFQPESDDPHSISSTIIRSILYDRAGNLWIGTDKGLNYVAQEELNNDVPTFHVFREGKTEGSLINEYILKLFQASNGKVWMGSMGGGLIGVDQMIGKDSILFNTITVKDGLPNNSIKSIEEDQEGNLWLSSNQGLSRYNPVTQDIVNYDKSDGLQGSDFEELASSRRQNGELLFGGINGLNTFYPAQIRKDTIKPKLYFSELSILNEVVQPRVKYQNNVILKNSIEHTDLIVLTHEQNSFSVAFAGLHFNSPQKVKYQYILEGFDKTWTRANVDHRIAKYTNVPAGTYTLKVTASNSDNVETDEPIRLAIRIKPHPLLSPLAFMIYAVLFVLMIYLLYRIYKNIAHRKKEVLISEIEKRNAEEATQSKLRFFTNISHEFRTPLTLISIPLEKLLKGGKLTEGSEKKNLNIIKHNSDLMLRLVNQILDFRKLEQDKMQLSLQSLDIVAFIKDILQTFEPLAEQKQIDLDFQHNREAIYLSFDPDCVEKIVYNLLSNAIKFTPKDGKVSLEVNQEKERILIQVSDTGIGIKDSDKPYLFQRYFHRVQQDKIMNSGTGIGLSLIKGLVELHKGDIEVQSQEGVGTRFNIHLPMTGDGKASNFVAMERQEDVASMPVIESEIKPVLDRGEEHRYTLLIVEDNQELREIIVSIFNEKHEVLEAEDGKIGYDQCLKHNPDLVISDIMMPNVDGIQLLSMIKDDEKISHIPIMLLTAKSTIENQIEGFAAGADAYVSKPFNADVLYSNALAIIHNRERLRGTYVKEIEINPMLLSNSPTDVSFIEKILTLIEENLSDADFNVDKMAEAYGLSRNHLNRKIKALTGETTINFLRDIRLKHAAELLTKGKYNVSEVTWKVGYTDLGAFRKRFKDRFGVSPSDYIKQQKQ
ncbi:response regulator [Reichenbachiella carrageenanivorans]|uniref:histidine kinase n=1 Tax=Reichenbachiella carrageenanivorans TaxID=2979869 RepID=A0ABY6D222_9BACT|nr:hybrid sensor histidine kinase/response regulator transcription factor [Reichenbachiella carrageenanivorans]UXX79143.1 response regulator [Reichenbachiella carrageenanivorans]